ncbi:CRISPR-associated helicase Cas3', partial [Psychrobacter sp.]|uniref:CRISPR-associated helicase Cas3' n=1 Tax=Psychrobacter sp. TaxID=56811 RepID=UPI0025FC1BA6
SSASTESTSTPSLVLAHGSKNMNDTFQRLLANANDDKNTQKGSEETGDSINSQCHAWFASSNKRALLADIGVGTIDQALMAALPKKHQPLRLFGLHHKVLIFDEVHSADSYMFELLQSLLQVHLHQGGHAILLTATLSLDKREALAKLWLDAEQLEYSTEAVEDKTQCDHFPLATQVIAGASDGVDLVNEVAITSPERVARCLAVDFIHAPTDAVIYLVTAAQNQQCGVWVRNTVADAINAYDDLLAAGIASDNILLFHSRFALVDRKRIENEVLACFGKHSTAKQRAGKILIATQVFQESLDADADVMISDLCPIDYIIQRAGRLHRHQRDASGNRVVNAKAQNNDLQHSVRPKPTLMILAPEFTETPIDDKWYSNVFAKSQYVYQHTGQLWLTMRILMQQRCLDLPKDARLLIESVYSNKAQELIPEVLQAASKADVSQQNRKKYSAKDMLIDWQKGYSKESQSRWFSNETTANSEVGTRYQEMPTCEVVILNTATLTDSWLSAAEIFYADSSDFAIELSTLKISEKMADKLAKLPDGVQEQLKTRYRGLNYKRLWMPSSDTKFLYDTNKGLIELA